MKSKPSDARPWRRAQGSKVKLIVQDQELMADLFLLRLKNYEAVLGIECDCDLWEIFINWNFSTIDYVIYAEQYRDDSKGKAIKIVARSNAMERVNFPMEDFVNNQHWWQCCFKGHEDFRKPNVF